MSSLSTCNCFKILANISHSETPPLDMQKIEEILIPISTPTPSVPKVGKLKWEKALAEKFIIATTEVTLNSLKFKVEIETTDTAEKMSITTLIDSGATGEFIDRQYAKSCQLNFMKLTQPILIYNVNGTPNEAGSITEVVNLLLCYKNHLEWTTFCVTNLGRQKLLLRHSWLCKHNPKIDWVKGGAKMSRCPPHCCSGCQDELCRERIACKAEARKIEICSIRPLLEVDHDSKHGLNHNSESAPNPTDEPISIEEGDHILATGLFPLSHKDWWRLSRPMNKP